MLKIRPFSFWWKGYSYLKDKSHYRKSQRRCSERRGVLRNFAGIFFLLNCSLQPMKRETLAQVFWCEICEVSKNTFFTEQNASGWLLLSLWKDRSFYCKVPFSLSFISLKKILLWFKSRKKMFNAFYVHLLTF